jgi:hypothetical protein
MLIMANVRICGISKLATGYTRSNAMRHRRPLCVVFGFGKLTSSEIPMNKETRRGEQEETCGSWEEGGIWEFPSRPEAVKIGMARGQPNLVGHIATCSNNWLMGTPGNGATIS